MAAPKDRKEKLVVNIGIIGCGGIAQNHAFSLSLVENNARKIWKDHPRYKVKPRLYAMADIDDNALDGLADAFGVSKRYRGPSAGLDLIADPGVHAVFVLVPTVDHLALVLAAARAGKHVFCEKPLAFSPSDVEQMIAARDENGVIVQVGLVFRSAPQIHFLKKLLSDNKNKWGRPTNIIFRDSQEKPYKGAEEVHNSTWRGDVEKAHAGILFEHTIHDIDGMVSVFGRVSDVFARVAYHDKEGIETSVAAVIRFEGGPYLSVNSMWNDIDYSQRRMEIFFENAYIMITVDERQEKLVDVRVRYLKEPEVMLDDSEMDRYFRDSLGLSHVKAELSGPYYYEDLRFVDAIVNDAPAAVTLEQGLYVQRVIEACYESGRTGDPVALQ